MDTTYASLSDAGIGRGWSRSRRSGQTSPASRRLSALLRDEGLYTFVRWHTMFTNPPLSISQHELEDGFGTIDRAVTKPTLD